MLELLDGLAGLLRPVVDSPWLWLIVLLVAGLDAIVPLMPSETTVIMVAVLLGPNLPKLALLVVAATAGAVLGDCVSHAIGRGVAPGLSRRLRKNHQRQYDWVLSRVDRHAAMLICAARYLPGGRVATGLATGSLNVPWRRFVTLDLIGAGIWAVYGTLIGFVGGAGFAHDPAKGLLLAFAIGLAIVAIISVLRRWPAWASGAKRYGEPARPRARRPHGGKRAGLAEEG